MESSYSLEVLSMITFEKLLGRFSISFVSFKHGL